ncbi:TRIO and F-actin-binding protein-like protein [Lates japonicus]|uniref:TRIO and F-actin-binding protein-like protein n=1 Tax=Lates japonicus TaxID=270547 RepID=A0AAD3MAN8_LATJO|nr:TRIO and F-actin-binding protein-like protein [Lates japonicus]
MPSTPQIFDLLISSFAVSPADVSVKCTHGSMCCKVGVVLARGATPAPVPRANSILPSAWWAAEPRRRSESVDNAEAGNLSQP